jgi:deoxyribonuclease-4
MARRTTPDGALLGAHVSIAGGAHLACERGREIGCDAIQVFTKSPTQWRAGPLTATDGKLFREARERFAIRAVVAHDTYLINLAAARVAAWDRSIAAFAEELRRCAVLGIDLLVTHPGSPVGKDASWGVARVARALDRAFAKLPADNRVTVLLETTAGMGSSLGRTFEELAAIRAASAHGDRIGYCLDTAHVLAAGYDYRDPAAYTRIVAEFDRVCGLGHLRAIHLNDSKKEAGTRVDRHDRLGKGVVGRAALTRWAADPRFRGLPVVLETPGGMESFAADLKLLRGWVRRARRS